MTISKPFQSKAEWTYEIDQYFNINLSQDMIIFYK